MDKRNPCDVCSNISIEKCSFCSFGHYTSEYQCCNWDCFLNYEGDCIVSVFDNCGAWKLNED